ncbi:hypothetical protein JCM11251_006403 [Rhodosporidiobolus azoricus]
MSPLLVHCLQLEVRRLTAPVHANLATNGQQACLSVFASTSVKVGDIDAPERLFFISPLPAGVDAILGVPWLKDTGTAVSATLLYVVPSGPSDEVYNFAEGRFVEQPDKNLEDLGFVSRKMDDLEAATFVLCALKAGVPEDVVLSMVEQIELEPHNPLVDVPDDEDPAADISLEEARTRLSSLLARYAHVFVDELPGPPPFRPINHEIPLKDPSQKI